MRSLDGGRDARDGAVLSRAFAKDGHLVFGASAVAAHDWIAHVCASADVLPSVHRTVSSWIWVAGDAAWSESHCIACVTLPNDGTRRFLGGRYLDRHRHVAQGGWVVATRRFILDWTANVPAVQADHPLLQWWTTLPPGADWWSYPAPGDESARSFETTIYDALAGEMRAADHDAVGGALLSCHAVTAWRWRHRGSQLVVERDIFGIERKVSQSDDLLTVSRKDDVLERRRSGWTLVQSRCEPLLEARYATAETNGLPFERGRADSSDPVFAFWSSASAACSPNENSAC